MNKKSFSVILALTLIFMAGVYKWSDYRTKWETGYCFEEKKYLTNRQLSDVVVTQLLENLELEYISLSASEKENAIRYMSLDDFYSQNPNCCKMFSYSAENKESWYKRLDRNRESGYVSKYGNQIIGYLNYQHDISGATKYRKYPIRLSYCGELYKVTGRYSTGTPLSVLPGSLRNK